MVEFGRNNSRSLSFRFGVAFTLATNAYIAHLLGQAERTNTFVEGTKVLSRDADNKATLCRTLMVRAVMALGRGAPTNLWLQEVLALSRRLGITNFPGWYDPIVVRLAAHALATGIEANYVTVLVRKRRLQAPTTRVKYWPWEIKLRVLGAFSVSCSGEPLAQNGKSNRHTLDTLKAIVVYRGRKVAIDHLSAASQLDTNGDSAKSASDVAIHRLCKLFGNADAIVVSNGKVRLNMHLCGLDLWMFQARRQIALNLAKTPGPNSGMLLTAALDTPATYIGNSLADEAEQSQLLPQQERLRAELMHTVFAAEEKLETLNASTSATTVYQRTFRLHPTAGGICRHLLECLRAEGRSTEASALFAEWQHTLKVVYGAAPSPPSMVMLDWIRQIYPIDENQYTAGFARSAGHPTSGCRQRRVRPISSANARDLSSEMVDVEISIQEYTTRTKNP